MSAKEELQSRVQLVRVHEANCKIEFPTPHEANFRIAVMKKLGRDFGLREVKPATISGPVRSLPPQPPKRSRQNN